MSIDYHPLAYSHMRNPNVSTEILGNIAQGTSGHGSLYAVATLDGTLMLVQDEQILWSIQVDHQLFALCKLDVNADSRQEVLACSWDGQTYIVSQEKQSVRFQFDHPVSAFCAGHFSLNSHTPPSPALVYATFHNKIYLYYNVSLARINLQTMSDIVGDLLVECQPSQVPQLVSKVLYRT